MRRQYRSSILLLLALHIVYDSNAQQLDSAKATPPPSLSGFPPPELDGLAVDDACRVVPIITPFVTPPAAPTPPQPTRAKVVPARTMKPINQLPAKKPTNQSPTRSQEQPNKREPTTNHLSSMNSLLLRYLLINSGRPTAGYVPRTPAYWLFPGYGVMSQNVHSYLRKTVKSRNKGHTQTCCWKSSDVSDSDSSEES